MMTERKRQLRILLTVYISTLTTQTLFQVPYVRIVLRLLFYNNFLYRNTTWHGFRSFYGLAEKVLLENLDNETQFER